MNYIIAISVIISEAKQVAALLKYIDIRYTERWYTEI